jgi:cytochrome b561
MKGFHALGSNISIALLALHVLAALKHHFINRDNVLRRMLP